MVICDWGWEGGADDSQVFGQTFSSRWLLEVAPQHNTSFCKPFECGPHFPYAKELVQGKAEAIQIRFPLLFFISSFSFYPLHNLCKLHQFLLLCTFLMTCIRFWNYFLRFYEQLREFLQWYNKEYWLGRLCLLQWSLGI